MPRSLINDFQAFRIVLAVKSPLPDSEITRFGSLLEQNEVFRVPKGAVSLGRPHFLYEVAPLIGGEFACVAC